jgi:hypothetical protein
LRLALLVEIFAAFRIPPSAALTRLLGAPTFTRPIIALLPTVWISLALLLARLLDFLSGLALSGAVLSIALLVLPLSLFALILLIAILLICHDGQSLEIRRKLPWQISAKYVPSPPMRQYHFGIPWRSHRCRFSRPSSGLGLASDAGRPARTSMKSS